MKTGGAPRRRFTWNRLLWALVFPRRRQRITPTVSGLMLIGLSMGIGTAAYNAANNILFITLSLLLACLILSGVLSWLNFRGVAWRLQVAPPLRVGQEAVVTLWARNTKHRLPTYGLWFELAARAVARGPKARAESTFTAKGSEVRAALARAGQAEARGRLWLRGRLDPRDEARLEWVFQPRQRGRLRIELAGVGSLFPFGFLKKQLATEWVEEVVVWPAPVDYRRFAAASARRPSGGERLARAGSGSDLRALRPYETGDSHRLIHWKASARAGKLLVRQFGAESAEGFALWVRTDAATWTRPEQFELMVRFAATLAEDLFRNGNLTSFVLDADPPVAVRRWRDVQAFLDRLAVAAVGEGEGASASAREGDGAGEGACPGAERVARGNLITFAPDGPRGVAAQVEGGKLAAV